MKWYDITGDMHRMESLLSYAKDYECRIVDGYQRSFLQIDSDIFLEMLDKKQFTVVESTEGKVMLASDDLIVNTIKY